MLRQSKRLTSDTTRYLSFLLLGLALTELAFLSLLVPLDAAAYDWVQAHRSCVLDHLAVLLKARPIILLVVLSFLVLTWLCVRRRWAEAWQATMVIALGGLLSELLKTGFERARPSVLPPLLAGNSFPSGHVATALLIAGTLGVMLARQRWATWVKGSGAVVCLGFVGVITWQRLYLGHHWLSDIIGSFLLAGAWLCFTLPRPAVLGAPWRSALVGTGIFVCYLGFYFFPQVRLALPSVMSTSREPLLALAFGEPSIQGALRGAWGEHTHEPAGPITWMRRGEASVVVPLPSSQAYILKLAVRPFVQAKTFACFPLEIVVNQQPVGRLLLYRGWREYELHLDPAWVVPGTNLMTFRAGAGFPAADPDQKAVAFRYLHLFSEGR